MERLNKQNFIELIKSQFRLEDQVLINAETDLTGLKEWSSLQTMILVSEIDKTYNVLLGVDEMKSARSAGDLYNIVNRRLQ